MKGSRGILQKIGWAGASALVGSALPAVAADFYQLNASSNLTITEHSACRKVTNASSNTYFVPTKSKAEWVAFRNNPPPGVTLESCCPTGFVLVPESPSLSLNEFCVMKWEARTSGSTAVATSVGQPRNSITRAASATACANMGAGYSLVTKDQWTAMLRDAEGVGANWSGGSRGVGCMFMGNIGVNNNCSYDGALREAGEANAKARFVFSNGEEVWHLNGNLSEWVMGSYTTTDPAADGSNFRMGARSNGGYSKMSAADRAAHGPLYDDYGSGCGSGDNSPHGNCGLGYYMGANGNAYMTRGGAAQDSRWDAWTIEADTSDAALGYAGFRCAYTP